MNNIFDSSAHEGESTLVEQYKKIKAENEALRAEIDNQRSSIETRFEELATLAKLLEARNRQIFLATSACLSLEGKMRAVMESFSWRITAPIRKAAKIFRKSSDGGAGAYFIRNLILKSSKFDADWYIKHHPEVLDSGMDALQYFITHGLPKWHDPGPNFSCDRYVGKYPDVAISGFPPFLHFIRHGIAEGRNSD
ncbi:hypothetical protein [Burkholderia multivorans]|uniref:hypothetical protein n=1 Tax=Burkholderia multivorans TaxID=87883 RepID=UPI001C249D8E|nr:hypothetical protein [Burkholderia multivorans]MBU9478464.1 hypothetical protein [Burkholderia multivorans]